jgi:hypothetical protein
MGMSPTIMRPKRRGGGGPPPANASITVTTPGVDATAEVFSVSGGLDEQVTFGDGAGTGSVHFDALGIVDSVDSTPDRYTAGGTGGTSIDFTANDGGAKTDMAKTSSGGGAVDVTIQGVTAVAEVVQLFLDQPAAGDFKITDGALTTPAIPWSVAWNTDPSPIESLLETTFGAGFTVFATPAPILGFDFVIARDTPGVRPNLTVTANKLTKQP